MIPVVILSHKRANNILTKGAIANCSLCVPEAQVNEYKLHNPDLEIVAHPDDVVGLSPKRQWVFEKFGDCFQVDDDILDMRRVYVRNTEKYPFRLTPDEAYWLIQDTYETAKQTKCGLWGFNRTVNPKAYSGGDPIVMNKYICGGGLGLIAGRNLSFPDFPYFVGEDYYISALNAHFNRYSYLENRFSFSFMMTEKGKGGCADYRTQERRKETYFYLKKKFGDAIIPKQVSTIKKSVNMWEKTLKIPY